MNENEEATTEISEEQHLADLLDATGLVEPEPEVEAEEEEELTDEEETVPVQGQAEAEEEVTTWDSIEEDRRRAFILEQARQLGLSVVEGGVASSQPEPEPDEPEEDDDEYAASIKASVRKELADEFKRLEDAQSQVIAMVAEAQKPALIQQFTDKYGAIMGEYKDGIVELMQGASGVDIASALQASEDEVKKELFAYIGAQVANQQSPVEPRGTGALAGGARVETEDIGPAKTGEKEYLAEMKKLHDSMGLGWDSKVASEYREAYRKG